MIRGDALGRGPAVFLAGGDAATVDRLAPEERAALHRLGLAGPRRAAWIRGRVAVRAALDQLGWPAGPVGAGRDGSPRPPDGAAAVSLSHDGEVVAVALAPPGGRVGVDLCPRAATGLAAGLLARRGIPHTGDAAVAWAALECALKLRHQAIARLHAGGLAVTRRGGGVVVDGLGPPIAVTFVERAGRVVAWSGAPC